MSRPVRSFPPAVVAKVPIADSERTQRSRNCRPRIFPYINMLKEWGQMERVSYVWSWHHQPLDPYNINGSSLCLYVLGLQQLSIPVSDNVRGEPLSGHVLKKGKSHGPVLRRAAQGDHHAISDHIGTGESPWQEKRKRYSQDQLNQFKKALYIWGLLVRTSSAMMGSRKRQDEQSSRKKKGMSAHTAYLSGSWAAYRS